MISVSEAKNKVRNNVQALPPIRVPLEKAMGLVLAEDVYAETDIPPFNQSAMDGYAFCYDDYQPGKSMRLKGEVPAGFNQPLIHEKGQAVRIFTGAPIPEGADTVVIQEKVTVQNNELFIGDDALKNGSNVRPKGSEIGSGTLALEKESYLSPAAIGFLAGIGKADVLVYPKPSVSIIVTGKELSQPGQPLQPGQVYESNSYMLQAALHQLGITGITVTWVDDDLGRTVEALNKALQTSDIVLLTGGISAGDYDYVLKATSLCGITQTFHKVAQKPGKPLYFGMKKETVVFGLPGNPSSVLTCFYEYVVPAVERLTKRKNLIRKMNLPLTKAVQKKEGLTHFLKGWCDEEKVEPLQAQDSYRLSSFARANCLICLEEQKSEWKEGEIVAVHILPS